LPANKALATLRDERGIVKDWYGAEHPQAKDRRFAQFDDRPQDGMK